MKNNGYDKGSVMKRFLFSDFFANLYYFFVMHIYVVLLFLGFCVGIVALLFVAELVMPRYVHLFNYSLTDTTFSQLYNSNRYHAAIDFMELKDKSENEDNNVLRGDEFYKFRMEFADCYVHTGDYPKALEQYELMRKQIQNKIQSLSEHERSNNDMDILMAMNDASIAKEEFRIYLKMGDKTNILACHNIIKDKYTSSKWSEIHRLLSERSEEFGEKFDLPDLQNGFMLELLQGEYIIDPQSTIPKMEDFAIEVVNSTKYNPGYQLTIISELIRMLIEQGRTIAARHYLEIALKIVDNLEYSQTIYPQLGDLSDYCYQLNDLRNGRRLLKKYLSHIDDTYDKSDIDYAVAHAKEFKYLQAEGDWDRLIKRVGESSQSIRAQIAKNFTGMTAAQREYFIEQFKPLFSYANDLLVVHPSDELARTCFENNLFLRGLLLRSETALSNSIAAMGDPDLSEKYQKYVELSKELVARQYISGLGNFVRKSQVENELSQLESCLASQCRDFRRENEKGVSNIHNLIKALSDQDVAMQIVKSSDSYYALLLTHDGKVHYQNLGNVKAMNAALASRAATYIDASVHAEWVDRLRPLIEGRNVYYSPDGIFNKISLSALPVESNGKTFGDIARINLVGALTDVRAMKEGARPVDLSGKNIALWGGIDYGVETDTMSVDTCEADVALRGKELRYLPGSKAEVSDIADMLGQNGSHTTLYTGNAATEKSLLSRSGRGDYILHISTHGFFHDSGAFVNPMQNAGLLFANSQAYWMNDSLVASITETDGILRADEIANLDLSGCRLVVLSACQTGLGESNSEGVYGLQRAFKLAGVQSILMSLWSVDDASTRRLMTLFYSELISGKSPGVSLTNAQNRLRREGYGPDKWAAFVLLD